MIRKYWWLVVFAVFVFLFDALLIQWIELMTTEHDKCRNMNSVNPLKQPSVLAAKTTPPDSHSALIALRYHLGLTFLIHYQLILALVYKDHNSLD